MTPTQWFSQLIRHRRPIGSTGIADRDLTREQADLAALRARTRSIDAAQPAPRTIHEAYRVLNAAVATFR